MCVGWIMCGCEYKLERKGKGTSLSSPDTHELDIVESCMRVCIPRMCACVHAHTHTHTHTHTDTWERVGKKGDKMGEGGQEKERRE